MRNVGSVRIHKQMDACMYTYMDNLWMYVYMHLCAHLYMYTFLNIYIYIHIHIYTYPHAYISPNPLFFKKWGGTLYIRQGGLTLPHKGRVSSYINKKYGKYKKH